MTEMVLVLPLILLVLMLLFYFGRGMVRAQRARVIDRYEAWRMAGEVPSAPQSDRGRDHSLLNQTFFGDRARSIVIATDQPSSSEAAAELTNSAYASSNATGDLAGLVLGTLPGDRRVQVRVTHDPGTRLDNQLNRTLRHEHSRIGNDWRLANGWRPLPPDPKDTRWAQWPNHGSWFPAGSSVGTLSLIRDVFLLEMDDALSEVDNHLARTMQDLIAQTEPSYVGPAVPLD